MRQLPSHTKHTNTTKLIRFSSQSFFLLPLILLAVVSEKFTIFPLPQISYYWSCHNNILENLPPYGRLFLSSCAGLQTVSATVGPFGFVCFVHHRRSIEEAQKKHRIRTSTSKGFYLFSTHIFLWQFHFQEICFLNNLTWEIFREINPEITIKSR